MSDHPPYRLPRNVVPRHYAVVLEPDFEHAAFRGEATVDLEVTGPVTELVLNAADLDITEATLAAGEGPPRAATVSYRPAEEQAVIGLGTALGPCPARLRLRFSGQLNDLLRGFYRSRARGGEGEGTWFAVTQFEATDARRAFPCWDEPDLKATFSISVVAGPGLTALSNGREISSELLPNGKRLTHFAETIKMPTYLVAVVIGPLELTSPKDVDGVAVRIGHAPGRAGLTDLAEAAAAHALRFLRHYFSMPYAGDKLDHVGVPDFASGAMENFGLVTYREATLLVGEASSQIERQQVVEVIAHETAHMWFGDLVTMQWWEGIWLNEAFATLMELLVTDDFEPRWQVWTTFGAARAAALSTDSLRASRAIEYPVGRPEEAEDMFDVITYQKGGSVLRMIERYLGDAVFRQGLHLYLEKHKFANTVTTDLWDALESASGLPVRATMGTWVNQPGHPIVSVVRSAPAELTLSQQRFLLDGGAPGEQRWVVPVSLRYATASGEVRHEQLLLDGTSATVRLEGEPAWALVNEGAWGVYRCLYSPELREALYGYLGELDARERLSLVSDTWAGTVAGLVPLESSLDLWARLRDDRDPDVWWAVSGGLGLLDLVCRPEERPLVQRLAQGLAGELLARVGWDAGGAGNGGGAGPDAASAPREARLRSRLVTLLGTVGSSPEVREEARRRMTEADAGRASLAPDLATAVAQVVAAGGGEAEWEMLHTHYREAATPQDEVRYLQALAAFSDPALLARSLELTFSGQVRAQEAPDLLMAILGRRAGCALAWEAIEQHWDEIVNRWPTQAVHNVLEALPALVAAGDDMAHRAVAWLDDHPMARGQLKLAQWSERLMVNLAFKHRVSSGLGPAVEAAVAALTTELAAGPGPAGAGPAGAGPAVAGPRNAGPRNAG